MLSSCSPLKRKLERISSPTISAEYEVADAAVAAADAVTAYDAIANHHHHHHPQPPHADETETASPTTTRTLLIQEEEEEEAASPSTTTDQIHDDPPIVPDALHETEATTAATELSSQVKNKRQIETTATSTTEPAKIQETKVLMPQSPQNSNVALVPIIPRQLPLPQPGQHVPPMMVLSKHEEKWNSMLDRLMAFRQQHGHTRVPQCYPQDPRLGRWVHYQRAEYALYAKQTATGPNESSDNNSTSDSNTAITRPSKRAKITPDRIARLNAIQFDWDPNHSQWLAMYDKLRAYRDQFGHCQVPKNWSPNVELAHWVRNQRLEYHKKQKSMTRQRQEKLNALGFAWHPSTTTTATISKKESSNE